MSRELFQSINKMETSTKPWYVWHACNQDREFKGQHEDSYELKEGS